MKLLALTSGWLKIGCWSHLGMNQWIGDLSVALSKKKKKKAKNKSKELSFIYLLYHTEPSFITLLSGLLGKDIQN